MKKKLIVILLSQVICYAQGFGLRQKIQAKVKERIEEKLEKEDAPIISTIENNIISGPGTYTLVLKINGTNRYYKLHVPKSYQIKNPPPLIMSLHGGGGDMNIQSNDNFYHIISKSEEAGFLAVFPNGFSKFKSGKLATWNAGKCCGDARDKESDDILFIKNILIDLNQRIKFNNDKVFAIGMSNGAMMSYRIACELPHLFHAIAAVAGTDNTERCEAKDAISIMHIHARDDDHVQFNGGIGKNAVDAKKITNFNSVKNTIDKWKQINKCTETKKTLKKNKDVICEEYSECLNKTKVRWCFTSNGAHSWPGGKKPYNRGSSPSNAISATNEIWTFFKDQ